MDRKLKHLEFIQAVINRLSTNSFLLKGWSVVLSSALFALAAKEGNVRFVILAYLPAVIFWGLDGYFLSMERAYRRHYERVRTREPDEIDFAMNMSDLHLGFRDWLSATLSKTLLPFHGVLVLAIIIVMVMHLPGGK